MIHKYFSHSVDHLFAFLMVSLEANRFQCVCVPLVPCASGDPPKEVRPEPR